MTPNRAKQIMRRPTALLAAAGVAVLVALAGCGGTGYMSSSGAGTSAHGAPTGPAQAQPAPSAAKPSADPGAGGIPQNNGGDQDADNNGGPSDGDGNV